MADLPPLATAADLETAMQRESGSISTAALDLALRRASARVRSFTRQDLTLVEHETVVLGGGGRVLALPQRPLVVDDDHPLTVVELADPGGVEVTAVEDVDYTRLGSELTRAYPYYAPTRTMGWPWTRRGVWAPRVRVTYSHGEADVPDDIVDIVLELASMNLANPENLRSVSIDDYARTFASETIGNARLTPGHRADLRPYRRTAFSVVLS
ncbi:hypothetical protein OG393_31025 [Streptomyces sp. NBC_01216]|uniref:hypothetical protein n=1 Tax=Streptomyces sp. NBC_01216 TaxID=2903778 RepID=UPI002E1289E9|nr:hypothetical protein OG393_31025 [Streptomyces sp. NBC_01216]